MKGRVATYSTIVCLLALTAQTAAAGARASEVAPGLRLLESAALIGAGGLASLGVHEGAHELTGLALGDHLEWKGSDWTVWDKNHSHVQVIAGAGFVAQAAFTEAVMDLLPPSNPLRLGAGGFYVVNTTQYLLRSALAPGGYGDLQNFSSRDRAIITGVLGVHVVTVAIRLLWPDALPAFVRGAGLAWGW